MLRNILVGLCITVVFASVVGCCVEGQPVRRTSSIEFDEVPPRVQDAFRRGYGEEEVARVEKSAFDSVCAGDDDRFRFHLHTGHEITLNEKGSLSMWVDGPEARPSSESPLGHPATRP